VWIVPITVTADDLETNLRLLKQYIDDPPSFEDGKSGADLLRRKVVRKEYSDTDDPLSDSSGSESSSKPRKPTKKRKRRAADDEELDARKEKRRLADVEKRAMIKSAARIIDSDDDDDAEFFERERELRERMSRKALEGELPSSGTRKTMAKMKRPEKQRLVLDRNDEKVGSVNDEIPEIVVEESASPIPTAEMDIEQSENWDIDSVRIVKKRKVRRAVSISSDGE
jgi:hypothetical protein